MAQKAMEESVNLLLEGKALDDELLCDLTLVAQNEAAGKFYFSNGKFLICCRLFIPYLILI